MADVLSSYLEEIYKQIDKDGTSNPEQAALILKDIINHALDIPPSESKYVASLIYSNTSGILNFLKKTVPYKEFELVKCDIVRFVVEYVQQDDTENNVQYATYIKDTCISCFTRDQSLKVKIECIRLLQQLVLIDDEKMEIALDVNKLYQRFWKESVQLSKTTGKGGLKKELYEFMGVFCEYYPHIVGDSASRLLSLFLGILKQEMIVKKSKVELQVITGCFRGLSGYLVNFTQSVEEKSPHASEIFKFTKLCIMAKDYTRYEAPKAALTLLKRHCEQFKELATEEAESLYQCLNEWSNHSNKEVKYLALDTVDVFMSQVALCLSKENGSKKHLGILKKFMIQFQSCLTSSNSSTKEILMAVKGYGKFSKACSKIFSSNDMRLMFEAVLQRSEQCYISMDKANEDGFYQLPMFLESLSSLINCLNEVNVQYILPLEKIVIILFDFYPRLGNNGQKVFHQSLTSFIEAASHFPDFFYKCLPQLVYQCLIRTCSCPLHMEKLLNEPQQIIEEKNILSYKTFLPIWQYLLDSKNYKQTQLDTLEKADGVKEQVYDEVMRAILIVLKKLNVETLKNDGDDNNEELDEAADRPSENQLDMKALMPSDFAILINLVDLYRDVFLNTSTSSFQKWIPTFVEDVVLLSIRHPLVSGFYKLLQDVCKLIEINCYFVGFDEENSSHKEKLKIFLILKSFMKEVSGRLKQFNGDLLISCVEFILNLPLCVLKTSLMFLVKPLKIAFEVGLSHYDLANTGLNTLENLNKNLPKSKVNSILEEVLPCLDDYLQSSADLNQENQQEVVTQTKSERRIKRASVKFFQKIIRASKQVTESPLTRLKVRIINFLGRLGGASNMALLHNSELDTLTKAIRWDTKEHLLFSLPFQDIKPGIYLDSFLPRVIELALSSSVRQTKVVACELLHALVLYMMGITVQKSYERNQSSGNITNLYVKVFPAMLKLACSVEQVAEQLFRPLVFQTIHWLTGNLKFESQETMALLDALLEGVSSGTDNSLREFSAVCVKEFFQWSIKQTTSKKTQESPVNVKSLLKRIRSLALHPNVYKRFGAALVMNNIYRIFREKEELVNIYVLDLVVLFVDSLSLAHQDEKSAGTVTECEKVIENLKKIVVKKKALLFKGSKVRKRPLDFKKLSNEDFTLAYLNIWLLRKCGAPATACRHICMKLAHAFIPLQPGAVSLKNWLETTLKANAIGGAKFFTDKFEKGSAANYGIRNFPTLDDRVKLSDEHNKEKSRYSLDAAIDWLENLLGALDCYCWIIGEGLFTPEQLFQKNKSSNILKAVGFFLQNICSHTPESLAQSYCSDEVAVISLKEKFNRIKCTVLVRTMNFLCIVTSKGYLKAIKEEKEYYHETFYSTLTLCIFSPDKIGFIITDQEVLMHLPNEIEMFVNVMKRFCSPNIMEDFTELLVRKMKDENTFNLKYFGNSSGQANHEEVSGYILLHKLGLLPKIFSNEELSTWCQSISSNLSSNVMTDEPITKMKLEKYFELGLLLDKRNDIFIQLIVCSNKDSRSMIYSKYAEIFNVHFLDNPLLLDNVIDIGKKNRKNMCVILLNFITWCIRKTIPDKKVQDLYQIVSKKWSVIKPCLASLETYSLFLEFTVLFTKLLKEKIRGEEEIFQVFTTVLLDSSFDITSKEVIIEFLPYLTSICTEKQVSFLKDACKKFIISSFPMKSTDLSIGSSRYISYITCLQKFMKDIIEDKSGTIFSVLLSTIIQETENIYESMIKENLILLIKRMDSPTLKMLIETCFEVFDDHVAFQRELRENVIERVILLFLNNMKVSDLLDFYKTYVKKLMVIIEGKLNKTDEKVMENQLMDKICAYKMISVLFHCLPKEDSVSQTSAILLAYCQNPTTGKELTSALSRAASAAFKEDMRGEVLCLELKRRYHCAAYNCLVSIICCTQNELKFYTGLLFTENLAKGALLFENLIDLNKNYHFDCELTMAFSCVKTLQVIRKNHSQSPTTPSKHRGYLSSQYLMNSSFSQDVNQFDFNTPAQAFSSHQDTSDYQQIDSNAKQDNKSNVSTEQLSIELDEVNKHECMQVFIGVITHMMHNKIYQPPSTGQKADVMPSWMMLLHKKMLDKTTKLNVKIFISKLIINLPKVFEPYGHFWFGPLTDFILGSQIDGPPLNYFIVDIIVVMLSWSQTVVPEDDAVGKGLCSSLLDYLFKFCHHNNRVVLKNNLQIIKTLINAWKDRLEISYKFIYDQFKNASTDTKDNTTGLQLLGLVVGAGFQPLTSQSGINETSFFADLTRNLSYKYKEVFATAAEVCGMIMKYYDENNQPENGLSNKLDEYLVNFSKTQKDRFVTCLHSVHLHYPSIVDRYIPQLLYCLLCLYGYLKTQCLQCIAARIDQLKDQHNVIYQQLKGKEMINLLMHMEEDTQIAALQVAISIAQTVDEKNLLELATSISTLKSNSVKIRERVYDFFIWTFDEQKRDGKMDTDENLEILRISKEVMLLGINDSDTDLSLKVLNFWRDATRLPVTTIERLIETARALYSNKSEREFLSYSTNLMLQLTSLSPDYNRPIFESGLDSEESFRNYHVNFSWQRQNIAMTPLFVATQDQSQIPTSASFGVRMLEATQTAREFTQTMDVDPSINWMNPSCQITSQSFSPTLSSQSSSGLSALIGGQPFASSNMSDAVDGLPAKKADSVLKLKQRVLKDKFSRSMKYASIQIRKNKMRKAEKDRQAIARDQKVVMYRKYRAGELPDIKIKHSEIIVPLQALSQLDSRIAKLLFSNLFNALVSKFPEKFTEETMDKAYNDIEESLDIALKTSSIYSSTFISTLLEISHYHKEIKLDSQHISIGSVMSSQQPVGILTLEKQLLTDVNVGLNPKQAKITSLKTESLQSWLELAKVYDSIDDYDMLRSIFSEHISKADITKKALAAESQNQYDVALNLYRDASRKEDWEDSPVEEEEEYWDKARLRCYENLTMWSNLRDFTIQSMSDGESSFDASKIWQDDVLQEYYLQYYIKSNIKLLCQGHSKDESHKEFTKFLENSMKDSDTKEILQARYGCDLALVNILQENYGNAQHYLNIASQTFLNEWSQLSKLVRTNRMVHLLPLQKITEMREFVELMLSGATNEEKIEELLNCWCERLPDKRKHNVVAWDDIIMNRCAFIGKLKDKFRENEALITRLESSEMSNILSIANVARKQGNFAVANQYLKKTSGIFSKNNLNDHEQRLSTKWRHVYIKVRCDIIKNNSRDLQKNVSSAISAFAQLGECGNDESFSLKQNLLQFDIVDSMLHILDKRESDEIQDIILNEFSSIKLLQDYTDSLENCCECLHSLAFNSLKNSLKSIDDDDGKDRKFTVKVLEKMAVYCDDRIKQETLSAEKNIEFSKLVIENLLRAMRMGSSEARLRFPRLLQLIENFPESQVVFAHEVVMVPCWMFLSWINQIIAVSNKNAQSAILPILKNIARSYPQALIFPLNVMKDHLQFDETSDGKKRKKHFQILVDHVLQDLDVAKSLILALGQLTNPYHIILDFHSEAEKLIAKRKFEQLKKLYDDLYHKLLYNPSKSSNSQEDIPNPGRIAKEFQKVYGKKFEEMFGIDGSKLLKMDETSFQMVAKTLTDIKKKEKDKTIKGNLKDFSPWLSNFNASNYPMKLEIPGQYTGHSKPMPEYHVNIAAFDEKILILTSMRRPKRITIRGDDENDYKFLVKGGEDLRQDQRLEQIFDIMNITLKKDSLCSNRLVSLKTYQVIPMTTRLGMIEWLDNTIVYADILKANLDRREEQMLSNSSREYLNHIKKFGVKDSNYAPIFDPKHNSKAVEQSFSSVVNLVPWDMLRRAFQSYASSLEAYYLLRMHFIQSYSCMCIAQYIVGVGDRHLSNMLIDRTTGGVIGIDFGHAFGTATQLLPTPELMPFRLTKQLLNFVLPVEGTSPYKQNMIAVMKAFRGNSSILLNTMDIFITEPLIEWEGHAKKQAETLGQAKDSESLNAWYPKHKIDICRQKLSGINPAYITAEEVRLGHGKRPAVKNFIRVVKGESRNIRAKYLSQARSPETYCLTVDEQVDCLVDQATDPAILSRTYLGWQPFI